MANITTTETPARALDGSARLGPEDTKRDWFWLALIVLVGCCTYLPWLGSYGPLDPTDSFFLESAREMIETGRYLLPLTNYEPWLDKPILYFWMVVGSYKLFGISAFAGRLPAALSAVATAAIMFYGVRGLVPRRTAVLASLLFLSLPLVSVVAHVCLTDMTLTACITGTTLFLWRGLAKRSPRDLWLGYIACACGILCKGPIAPILSLIALVPAVFLATRSIKKTVNEFLSIKIFQGLSFAALLNLPWYAAAAIATNGKFLEAFFFQQNFGRMVGTVNHQMPWWFYIPVFFGGFAPWCLLTVSSLKTLKRPFGFPTTSGRRGLLLLSICWFVIVMVLFSAIKTKLPTYILPACPAFAIMIAIQLESLIRSGKMRPILITAAIGFIGAIGAFIFQGKFPGYLKGLLPTYWPAAVALPLMLGAGIALAFRSGSPGSAGFQPALAAVTRGSRLKGRAPRAAVYLIVAALLMGCTVFVPGGLKAFYNHKQVGFNRLTAMTAGEGNGIAIMLAEEPSIPYMVHHPVHRLLKSEDATAFMNASYKRHYLFVPQEMLVRLDWFPGATSNMLAKEGKWCLFEIAKSN